MTRADNDDQTCPYLKTLFLRHLRHFSALHIILQLRDSICRNPFLNRSIVDFVPLRKFKLKNLGERVVAQVGCFSDIINFITANWYIQVVNSEEFPFGNYQPSGNLEQKVNAAAFLV
jgi:hypothetical protein